MVHSTAKVDTDRPQRYAKQLAVEWHRDGVVSAADG